MVLTTTCNYSGRQILPGYGKRFAKNDKSIHVFLNSKCAAQFEHKWNPRKVVWTVVNRRARGKDLVIQSKRTHTKKAVASSRTYSGMTSTKLDELRKKYGDLKK
ncbi:Ribosomal_protein L24 [Hexamita inflata]|uniref:Ribosomal protein L24 n=1 Tax=Hexamita inflata TaxID=28002 RepID=A0AA86RGL3_9EUKA|nr:Ribosomal protein L24 [Hexamita inflata]CAI9969487.1 Ribosomal protein L24 [Hexamita inflata]CAI9976147.1 Ribosomal protein L24 [Hexamita inflata]